MIFKLVIYYVKVWQTKSARSSLIDYKDLALTVSAIIHLNVILFYIITHVILNLYYNIYYNICNDMYDIYDIYIILYYNVLYYNTCYIAFILYYIIVAWKNYNIDVIITVSWCLGTQYIVIQLRNNLTIVSFLKLKLNILRTALTG